MEENKFYFVIIVVAFCFVFATTQNPTQTQEVNQNVQVTQTNKTLDISPTGSKEIEKYKEIDKQKADKIVKYIKNNSMDSIRELKKLKGVGERELELIQRHIKVGD